MIESLILQISQLKEQLIEEIIKDESLTKLQKLRLLAEQNLFPISSSVKDEKIFVDWIEELEIKVKKENVFVIVDTFLSRNLERYEIFFFYEVETLLENYIYSDFDGDITNCPDLMPVVKDRSLGLTIERTAKEIVDKIYDYAIKNRICGYENDW